MDRSERQNLDKSVNALFYNPLKNKSADSNKSIILKLSELLRVLPRDIQPLQFADAETSNFISSARVFKIKVPEGTVKARYCSNETEARRTLNNVNYARSIGVPCATDLYCVYNFALFSYVIGNPLQKFLTEQEIGTIGKIQGNMNSYRYDDQANKYHSEQVSQLEKKCLFELEHSELIPRMPLIKLKESLRKRPPIYACFDHQDFGKHNLIVDITGNYHVMDEEAFGILPLGYGVVRPLFDRDNYRIADSVSLTTYLAGHDQFAKEYILENINYFRALFIARNSLRRLCVKNESGAIQLIREAEQL